VGPGPDEVGQKDLKVLMALTKNSEPQVFFMADLPHYLAKSFEDLNSSLAQSPGKICSW